MSGASGVMIWRELVTTDVDAASSFYTDLLPWSVRRRRPGVDYFVFEVDSEQRGSMMPTRPDGPRYWFNYVYTDDLDRTVDAVTARSGRVIMGKFTMKAMGRAAVLSDPWGGGFVAFESSWRAEHLADPPVYSFGPTDVFAPNVERAQEFYAEVFQWTPTTDATTGWQAVEMRAGDDLIVTITDLIPGVVTSGAWVNYLLVDDVQLAQDRAVELGAESLVGPEDAVGMRPFLRDPAGTIFGLSSFERARGS
jgi:predicted enzyme related to lactoylglutathione lyase